MQLTARLEDDDFKFPGKTREGVYYYSVPQTDTGELVE